MKFSTLIVSALFSILTAFLSGCAGGGSPEPAPTVMTDKTLPQVRLNGHLSDTDAIAFEWKPLTDPRVKGVRIYRDNPGSGDKSLYRVASIGDRLQTHYVDGGLEPGTAYRYRFTTGRDRHVGVLAQDVMTTRPDAVCRIAGVMHVNYAALFAGDG